MRHSTIISAAVGGHVLAQLKHVGPHAGVLKYDLLTALSVTGLHGTPTQHTSLSRLSLLITARYNWRVDEVSIGHAELAVLWAVNDRTVKREMKRLLDMGVFICTRPGVRGRVGAYRLNYRRIYEMSRPLWRAVGTDFEARMIDVSGERTVVAVDFSARMSDQPDEQLADMGSWGAVRRRLKDAHPEAFENWFAKLVPEETTENKLVLKAPNSFVSAYIETHFSVILARAVEEAMPTSAGQTRRIMLIS